MEFPKSNKYLIDSNILIYSVHTASALHTRSIEFLNMLYEKEYDISICTQNILEFKRVLTHPTLAATKQAHESVNQAISLFLQNFNLIYEDKAVWLEFQRITSIYKLSGNEIFDAWLVAAMICNNIDTIFTLNGKHFARFKEIKIINPF